MRFTALCCVGAELFTINEVSYHLVGFGWVRLGMVEAMLCYSGPTRCQRFDCTPPAVVRAESGGLASAKCSVLQDLRGFQVHRGAQVHSGHG